MQASNLFFFGVRYGFSAVTFLLVVRILFLNLENFQEKE